MRLGLHPFWGDHVCDDDLTRIECKVDEIRLSLDNHLQTEHSNIRETLDENSTKIDAVFGMIQMLSGKRESPSAKQWAGIVSVFTVVVAAADLLLKVIT